MKAKRKDHGMESKALKLCKSRSQIMWKLGLASLMGTPMIVFGCLEAFPETNEVGGLGPRWFTNSDIDDV